MILAFLLRSGFVWFIMALALGYLGGVITRGKGLPFAVGFVLGFFLPFVGVLIAAVLPSDLHRVADQRAARQSIPNANTESAAPAITVVPCPACRARISPKAAFCEKCGVNVGEARSLQAVEWNAGEEEEDDDFNDELY